MSEEKEQRITIVEGEDDKDEVTKVWDDILEHEDALDIVLQSGLVVYIATELMNQGHNMKYGVLSGLSLVGMLRLTQGHLVQAPVLTIILGILGWDKLSRLYDYLDIAVGDFKDKMKESAEKIDTPAEIWDYLGDIYRSLGGK